MPNFAGWIAEGVVPIELILGKDCALTAISHIIATLHVAMQHFITCSENADLADILLLQHCSALFLGGKQTPRDRQSLLVVQAMP